MNFLKTKSTRQEFRNTLSQVLAVTVKNFLMMSFGMNLGFPTILIGGLLQKDSGNFEDITVEQLSWLGSMSLLTVPIGSLISGVVTQPFGRKRSMQLITIPFIACWIGFYFSEKLWGVYFALALMGSFGGVVEAPFMSYVSEITEPHLRGLLSTLGSVFVIIGILLQFILGTFYKWRTCAIISCILPTMTFILFFFVPESPYWLLLNNRVDEAKSALAWVRGWTTTDNVELEVERLVAHLKRKEMRSQDRSACLCLDKTKLYLRKSFIWPFAVTSFTFFLSQFSGASTAQTYALNIFTTLNVPIDAYNATVLLGVVQLIGCSLGGWLTHALGRRKLMFLSLAGAGCCNALLAIYAHINDITRIVLEQNNEPKEFSTNSWIPLILVLSLNFIDHWGVYFLPWNLIGELYSNETRCVGCGISSSVSYLLNFISNKLYLKIVMGVTIPGTYILYGCVCFTGIIIIHLILPETEGKTLEEISNHFEGNSKLDNRVRRKNQNVKGYINHSFENDVETGSTKL